MRIISDIGTNRRPPSMMVLRIPDFASLFAASLEMPNAIANSPNPKARRCSLEITRFLLLLTNTVRFLLT
jgi:hypothetical protein